MFSNLPHQIIQAIMSTQSYIQRHRILFIHLSFWCVYFSFFYYQFTFPKHGQEPNWATAFFDVFFQVSCMATIAYSNYFYYLPRFLQHKKLFQYLAGLAVPFTVVVVVLVHGKRWIVDGYTYKAFYLYSDRFTVSCVLSTLFIVVFVGLLKFVEDWFELEAKKKELENETLMAELRFLKAQINPHFLFNTLNNLYYLAFTNSPNTTEVIAKLSQMMRYMIYDSNHNKVPLTKEIEYMENYISLEELRLNNEIPIHFEVVGELNGISIVPLILITFLENAFKHGVSNNAKESYIKIKVEVQHQECWYSVENSKIPKNTNNEEKSGIGLQNVKRRLELSYPNQYDLKIEDSEKKYCVNLKLNLS